MVTQKGKREEVQTVHAISPCLSYTDIARMFNITPERVRQICGPRHCHKSELRYLDSIVVLKCTYCKKDLIRAKRDVRSAIKNNPNWHPFCNTSCSLKYYHKRGLYKNPTSTKLERNLEIVKLYDQGTTQYELAEIYDLDQSRISAIIRRFGNNK